MSLTKCPLRPQSRTESCVDPRISTMQYCYSAAIACYLTTLIQGDNRVIFFFLKKTLLKKMIKMLNIIGQTCEGIKGHQHQQYQHMFPDNKFQVNISFIGTFTVSMLSQITTFNIYVRQNLTKVWVTYEYVQINQK